MTLFLRELKIYLALFIVLALIMHFKAWIDHPIQHLESLKDSSLGMWHPLTLTTLVYSVIGIFRLLWHFVKRLFFKTA